MIIKELELDEFSRIDAKILSEIISKDKKDGLNPFVLIASAGTTDTGAVDPLDEIGNIAKLNEMWYHIDGAYGGFFVLTERAGDIFKGIEKADSLVIDPHKGLFLPYGLGAVLVKDKEALFQGITVTSYQGNEFAGTLHRSHGSKEQALKAGGFLFSKYFFT